MGAPYGPHHKCQHDQDTDCPASAGMYVLLDPDIPGTDPPRLRCIKKERARNPDINGCRAEENRENEEERERHTRVLPPEIEVLHSGRPTRPDQQRETRLLY